MINFLKTIFGISNNTVNKSVEPYMENSTVKRSSGFGPFVDDIIESFRNNDVKMDYSNTYSYEISTKTSKGDAVSISWLKDHSDHICRVEINKNAFHLGTEGAEAKAILRAARARGNAMLSEHIKAMNEKYGEEE